MNNPLRYIDPTGNYSWENSTSHSWDDPFGPSWNNSFSWGGYSSYNSYNSWQNYRSPISFDDLLYSSAFGLNNRDAYIQARMNLIAQLSRKHQGDEAKKEWTSMTSQYDFLATKISPILGLPLHPAVIASKTNGKFVGVGFDIMDKNGWKIFAAVAQGQPVRGQFKRVPEVNVTDNISFLILTSSDPAIVDRAFNVIPKYYNKESLYLFHLAGILGYQCWEGAEGVMDDIVRE